MKTNTRGAWLIVAGILIAALGLFFQLYFAVGTGLSLIDFATFGMTLGGCGIGFAGYVIHEQFVLDSEENK